MRRTNSKRSNIVNETAVLDAPVSEPKPKRAKVSEMTPQEKAEYYATLKARREAKKLNRFVPPAGAAYVDENGKYTFTANPPGYDNKKMADFVAEDFKSEDIWLDYKAGTLETRAAALRQEAEAIRKGGPRLKGDAKKLVKMQEKFNALRDSLVAEGLDVDAILAQINEQNAAKKAAAEAAAAGATG